MVANNRKYPAIPIPKISRSHMLWHNTMADKYDSASMVLDDIGRYEVRLFPAVSLNSNVPLGILFEVDGIPAPVWFSGWPLENRINKLIKDGDIAILPVDLRAELVETALKPLLAPLAEKTGTQIRVVNFLTRQPSEIHNMSIGFNLMDSHDSQIRMILVMHEKLVPVIRKMMSHWPSRDGHLWEHHVTTLCVEVASLTLPLHELRTIDAFDVIMLNKQEDIQNHKVILRNGAGGFYKSDISTHQLTLESGMIAMSDEAQIETETMNTIDDIPVRLSFDIGEVTLPFNAVKSLTEGSIVDLNQPVSQAVTIRSGNKVLGFGELVDIEGKKGVRITSLFPGVDPDKRNG